MQICMCAAAGSKEKKMEENRTDFWKKSVSWVLACCLVVTLIPLAVLAVMGVDGDSLFQYLGHIFRHFLHRRTLHCRRVGYRYGQQAPSKKKRKRK